MAQRTAIYGARDAARESRDAKMSEMKDLKSQTKYKSASEIDRKIKALETAQSTTSMTLSKEKETLKEIGELKKQRAVVAQTEAVAAELDGGKAGGAADNGVAIKDLNEQLSAIKAEMDKHSAVLNKIAEKNKDSAFPALMKEKDELKAQKAEKVAASQKLWDDFKALTLRVALCQLPVVEDKTVNIETAKKAIASAAANGAELVVLPEVWNSSYLASAFPKNAEPVPKGPSSEALAQAARDGRVWLIGGSVPERDESGTIYNTCAVFNPAGEIVAKHRKVHLFDIDVPGKITFRESDTLTGGGAVTVIDSPWGRIGIGICYDIRFPELSHVMRRRGADILVFPGAFNCTTGPPHWELLQRARALDTQCFVLTASPARAVDNPSAYQAYGHSSVVDPWGTVLATTEHEPTTVWATLNLERIAEVRSSIPLSKQTRGDLYQLEDVGPKDVNK